MKKILFSVILLSAFILPPSAFPQGSLTPPGAPAPTMKTLDQIDAHITQAGEKRIDVLTLPGDGTNQFIISAPGSYYLTGNITGVSGKNGITINADNVSLDLNGFTLAGVSGGLNGIKLNGPHRGIRVHNGAVALWLAGAGIDLLVAQASEIDHVRAADNSIGINLGPSSTISHCTALSNSLVGFQVNLHSLMQHCVANGNVTGASLQVNSRAEDCNFSGNTGGYGVFLYAGTSLVNCTANATTGAPGIGFGGSPNGASFLHCTASGNAGKGIAAGASSIVKDCVAQGNLGDGIQTGLTADVSGCAVKDNGANGINVADGSTVSKCAIRENHRNGIIVTSASTIEGNTVQSNASDSTNALPYSGILVTGTGNRIEANHFTYHFAEGASGLRVATFGGRNLIIRNSATGNTGSGGDYSINFGNLASPVVSGSNIGSNTSPDPNYAF